MGMNSNPMKLEQLAKVAVSRGLELFALKLEGTLWPAQPCPLTAMQMCLMSPLWLCSTYQ